MTQRLSWVDAAFLELETEAAPTHVGELALFDLPPGFEGSFHDAFRRWFAARAHLAPLFGAVLEPPAFPLDAPRWAEAAAVDLDWHIRALRLPAPGGRAELEAAVAALHAGRLDRSRPLWRFTVIEGLEGGQAALYAKIHHASIDGAAGVILARRLYDEAPEPRRVPPPPAQPAPRPLTLQERALRDFQEFGADLLRGQLRMMEAAPRAAMRAMEMVGPALRGELSPPTGFAPRTPFNRAIGPRRAYAARSLPLAEVRAVAHATGTTLNDVVLALAAGALRAWLGRRNALPAAPLVAFVPVSLRAAGDVALDNQISGMASALATDCADPVERLRRIGRASRAAGRAARAFTPGRLPAFGASLLGLMRQAGLARIADFAPVAANLVVANNAGPQAPLYCAGARVAALHPVTFPMHGVGLGIAVLSYAGALDFGLVADADLIPDIDRLADDLVDAHRALRAALGDPSD